MKQRRSFSNLYYHVVTETKHRAPTIVSLQDELRICQLMTIKAKQHEAFIHGFGTWYDHVHLLLRARPCVALSKIYGEMKGFSSAIWNKSNPDRLLKWGDGVFVESVSPDAIRPLLEYIRNQRIHHSQRSCINRWELTDL